MTNLKTQVEQCLQKYPETRNSDIKLTNAIWYEYYRNKLKNDEQGNLVVRLCDLYDLPKEDNVKRWRAKFNSKGLYLPTEKKIIQKRKIKEEIWRSKLGYNPELRTI